ncbi:hypothetical protein [Microbacterium sp. cf332]|uniref:hypothetical protein n=1 Tax=Microbacterium sp. cf332 TaxID=1761804 RepID=UPI0008823739|nr:hypothetical protein [Microbacterium sp. cf332]SDQ07051.1 hypothetical protein SAMN04487847_0174 [Microbacterium sp. cf332]
MQVVLALIIGAAIGLAAEFVMPGRDARGSALAPLLGAAAGGLSWTALTWAGLAFDHPAIWAVSLLAPVVVVPAVLFALTRSRARTDAAERRRLRIG